MGRWPTNLSELQEIGLTPRDGRPTRPDSAFEYRIAEDGDSVQLTIRYPVQQNTPTTIVVY